MKSVKVSFIGLFVVMATILTGCQNEGNIGNLFGTWRVEKYYVNGENVSEVEVDGQPVDVTNVTFSFQTIIVNVVTVTDKYLSNISQFGTWERKGGEMILDFTYHDNLYDQGEGMFSAPTWIGMTSSAPMTLKESDIKKDKMTLTWTDGEGNLREYVLKKTW